MLMQPSYLKTRKNVFSTYQSFTELLRTAKNKANAMERQEEVGMGCVVRMIAVIIPQFEKYIETKK